MATFVFKLTLTPLLIYLASVASRRWGHGVAGWLVAMPLTAGPVVYFLTLENGNQFGAAAALGSLGGAIAETAFALTYSWCARRLSWSSSLLSASAAFAMVAWTLGRSTLTVRVECPVVILILIAALRLMPKRTSEGAPKSPKRTWQVAVRMITATALVIGLTMVAKVLGPVLSGVAATFPVYAATLAVFSHKLYGWQAAVQLFRGLLYGLSGFAAFFSVLSISLHHTSENYAFFLATAISLCVQGCSLFIIKNHDC
jgi:hypothetical protein